MSNPSSDSQTRRSASRPDGEISRARILDATERLLAERGYAGTSIAAISRESGLPGSSIYWFFESKQDLTGAVIERAAERFMDGLGESHLGAAPEARLSHLMGRALEQSGPRLPEFLRLELLLGLEHDPAGPAVTQRLTPWRERSRGVFEEAVEGALSALGPRATALAPELAELAMSFIRGALISSQLAPGSIDIHKVRDEMGVVLRAIAEHRLAGGSDEA